jgi:elongation factor G
MEPDWLVELAIEPVPAAWEPVLTALGFASRHVGLQVRANAAVRQVVLSARREEHLHSAMLYLEAAVPDGYRRGAVQAAYRATPASPTDATYTHKKQTGGSGEFAEVALRLAPGERGSGFALINEDIHGHIPARWVTSVRKGISEIAERDDSLAFPLTDFAVHLLDGKYHDLDSSPAAFERAGAGAMRKAMEMAGTKLLEPIVKFAVLAPERAVPAAVAELERRNAAIDEARPGWPGLVLGLARMADMIGFGDALSAATNGSASAAIILHGYVEVVEDGGPDDSYPLAAALRA